MTNRGPSKTADECAAEYVATRNHDPRAADLCEEIHNDDPGDDAEWAAINKAAPTSEQIRQIAQFLKDTGQAHNNDPTDLSEIINRPYNNDPDPYARPMSDSNEVMRKFLADVERAVCHDRQAAYDVPERNHARTAAIASQILDVSFTAEEVCLVNLSQKLSRLAHELTYDSLLDLAGYAANLAAIMAAKKTSVLADN